MSNISLRLRTLLALSYRCGGPFLADALHRERTKILMYHGVPTRDHFNGLDNHEGYQVPVREFKDHLEYLQRHCNVLSLNDFQLGRNVSQRRVNIVMTFDDGYENNYVNVVPLLEHYELPATFAIPTGFVIGRRPLYNDRVEYIVQQTTRRQVVIAFPHGEREFLLEDLPSKVRLYEALMQECTRGNQVTRDDFVDRAKYALDVAADADTMFANEDYRPLPPQAVRKIAHSDLFQIASHGVNHYMLSSTDRHVMRSELTQSKRDLETLTEAPCEVFCAPGGAWDRAVVDEAHAAGYRFLLTSDPGMAVRGQHVIGRTCVLGQFGINWFADVVRGPVHDLVRAAVRLRDGVDQKPR